MDYVKILIIALVVIILAKFVFKVSAKTIGTLIVNCLVGLLVLYLINWTNLVSIPLDIINAIIVGIFGLPGVVILVILSLLGITL